MSETILHEVRRNSPFTVVEVEQLEGLRANFDVWGLIFRDHTQLILRGTRRLTSMGVVFNAPVAVEDVGQELLRHPYIEFPEAGIEFLEETLRTPYEDTRYIDNPLNSSLTGTVVELEAINN